MKIYKIMSQYGTTIGIFKSERDRDLVFSFIHSPECDRWYNKTEEEINAPDNIKTLYYRSMTIDTPRETEWWDSQLFASREEAKNDKNFTWIEESGFTLDHYSIEEMVIIE